MAVEFRKLKIKSTYGKPIFDVYYVVENNRSRVMESFNNLPQDTKDQIKDLITKMASNPDFQSSKIRYQLSGYSYGEIKPMPHRYFFFQKCGLHYIFFEYKIKKADSLGADTYKRIEKLKKKYEKEFEAFIQRS